MSTEAVQPPETGVPRVNRRRNARVTGRIVREDTEQGEAIKIEYNYYDEKTPKQPVHKEPVLKRSGTTLEAATVAEMSHELNKAWEEEIHNNMRGEKKQYFLSFMSEDADEHAGKMRKRMRDIITNAQTSGDTTYFLGHNKEETEELPMAPRKITAPALPKPDALQNNRMSVALESENVSNALAMSPITESQVTFRLDSPQQKPQSPRISLFQRLFSPKTTEKTDSEYRYELRKYERKLLTWLKDSKTLIKQLHQKEIVLVQSLNPEMLYLTKCALIRVVPTFRSLCIIKMHRLKTRRDLEKLIKNVIKEQIRLTKDALMQDKLPEYVNLGFFKENVDYLIVSNEQLVEAYKYVKKLEQVDRQLTERYQNLRKQYGANVKRRAKKDQIALIRTALQNTKIGACAYNAGIYPTTCKDQQVHDHTTWRALLECMHNNQMEQVHWDFFSLVSDDRSTEGQSVRTFINEVKQLGWDKVPAKEIIDYVSSFVTFLCSSNLYRITDEIEVEKMQYLVHRYFFGHLMGVKLARVEDEQHENANSHFVKQSALIKTVPPSLIGVATKFLPLDETERPFNEPIEILSLLSICSTPNDMLHCVYTFAKQIHIIAKDNCTKRGKDFSFGADEFIPIVIYVVAHAFLPCIHSNLAFMSKYAGSNETNSNSSEIMYYLTCLEGGVVYIDNLTQEELDNLTNESSTSHTAPNTDEGSIPSTTPMSLEESSEDKTVEEEAKQIHENETTVKEIEQPVEVTVEQKAVEENKIDDVSHQIESLTSEVVSEQVESPTIELSKDINEVVITDEYASEPSVEVHNVNIY
jgi:uncharacterized protein YecT (DUF1311 family)